MTIREIKQRAKLQLGGKIFGNSWMIALLICLIFSAITAAAGSIIIGIGAFVVLGPMTYGLSYVFLKQARDGMTQDIGDLFCGFKQFGDTFVLGLLIQIFTILWSLLFIIPGIVKSYAYAMSYYIKADHPEYSGQECITESRKMMKGHKGELFGLDLSFIGWYIVGALCFGVGTLWVIPYHKAARAQFYENLAGEKFGTAPEEPFADAAPAEAAPEEGAEEK